MKKIFKRSLIGLGCFVGIIVLLFAGMMIKLKIETKDMKPVSTKLFIEGIYAVQDQNSTVFLIQNKDSFIAIDAGNKPADFEKELKKLNLNASQIKAVFLTHTDGDHVGAISLFKNAKIYLSKDEERMINGKTTRLLIFKNKLNVPYQTFQDGEEITVDGIKVKCILTPGHTPGSTSFVVNNHYLFTGDSLSLKNGSVEQFNEFFNMDTKIQKESYKKIMNLPDIKYIFTAHYGYSDNYEQAFSKWRN